MQPTLRETLEKRGAHFEVLRHPRAYGAMEEARLIGEKPELVTKTIVLDTDHGHALAVIPANRRLDLHRIREAVGDPHAHLATEHEIERDLPEYELGAIPPFGSLAHMSMYVDGEVLAHTTVAFADSQTETVKGPTAEIFAGEMATVAPITDWAPERAS